MYLSLIFSSILLPILGAGPIPVSAVPTNGLRVRNNTTAAPAAGKTLLSGSSTIWNTTSAPNINNLSNSTKTLDTINYFPDPVVHCSGRKLDDEDDSAWKADLDAAVTATSDAGVYGTCDAGGNQVDGDGVLAWKSGTVQVYYCNHGFTPADCSVNEYWRADDLINDSCGSNGGGWVVISAWSKTIGRDPTGSGGGFRSECGSSLHGVSANIVIDI